MRTRFLDEMHDWRYGAFRSALAVTLVPTDRYVVQRAPGVHRGRHPRPRHRGSLPPPRSLQPLSVPQRGRAEDAELGLGRRHLMLENRVHQRVSDPQEKQRQLPFSPSGSSLITDGINPGLMRCHSPAGPRTPCRSAGPRLRAGRLDCSLMCPGFLRELVTGIRRAFGLLNTVRYVVQCPLLIPLAVGIKVWIQREIFKGLEGNRGGKTRHSNNFTSVNLVLMLHKGFTQAELTPSGWIQRVAHCYPCPWSGHNHCIFLHAQTFQRWGSEIKLPTLSNKQIITYPIFKSFNKVRTSRASASSVFSSALLWCPFL